MKNNRIFILILLTVFLLSACQPSISPSEPTDFSEPEQTVSVEMETTEQTVAATLEATEPEVTETTAEETVATEPAHSPLYIPDVPVEDVICYFNEVCLDSEIINGGDPSYVQKWEQPIRYTLEGNYTDSDIAVLDSFVSWLNSMEGFPGISQTLEPTERNLRIYFCDQEEMLTLMGQDFTGMDGAVTFWYSDDIIYDAIICYRTDLDQQLRNSVILEEIYNGLGPIQDTALRPDSIIYQEFTQPQWLTPMDELILQLLYHPDIRPGMDAVQCEQIIRTLYY